MSAPLADPAVCPCCHRLLPGRGVAAMAFAAAEAVYGAGPGELRGAARTPAYVNGRALVTWAMRHLSGHSYPAIGRLLGNRDHATIIHLHKKALALRLRDNEFALACRALEIAEEMEPRHEPS